MAASRLILKSALEKREVLLAHFRSTISKFVLVALVFSALYLTSHYIHENIAKEEQAKTEESNILHSCDLFSGKWVYDKHSYPIHYTEEECSFLPDDVACVKSGRKDLNYRNWRWKPHGCDLPRFNGSAFLERLRGKRLVFVGDSLNRNQWLSMLCLLESSLPSSPKSSTHNGTFTMLQATEYNATIEFYWSPFLVESNCDDPDHHRLKNRTVRIEAIETHARHWTDADILVFDSYAWWLDPTITLLWGSFESPHAIYKKVTMRVRPYEIAMRTWSEWLEINVNRTKTQLFFMSMSPFHAFGEEWGARKGHNCYGETKPILKEEKHWGTLINRELMQIIETAINGLERRGVKVHYLNITHMSAYRKDAHPSMYRKHKVPPNKEQLAHPTSYSDCLHWCLPGLPDVWNQILYAYIMK